MSTYRILSLDGGGLRGLISARLLQRLSANPANDNWLDKADLITGTSTGGILALGLAHGIDPSAIGDLYLRSGGKIFDDSIWDDIRDLGKTVGADYSNRVLKRELKKIFGDTTLGQLGKKVAIPSFDLDNEAKDRSKRTWKPKIFHNFSGGDSDAKMRAADIALYTSAAPTYFPSADGYIDGGVFANNPSLVGLAQAISSRNTAAEQTALDDIVLLSVGTGVSLNYIRGKRLDWGYAQWATPLIDVLMDGVSGIADYQCAQLLGVRYQRLQIVFDAKEAIKLDDVKKLDRMEEIAMQHDLSEVEEWLAAHWG